jgi:hypothetical protein
MKTPTNYETPVAITINGETVTLPLGHFKPFLTSASLALAEWDKKALARCLEKMTISNIRDSYEYSSGPIEALKECRESLIDNQQRRENLERIEKLFTP